MNLRLSLLGSGRPGSHVFGAEGGAFGRSQKCEWVLPDDERILSSVHGRLVFRNGEFMLVDESTNGIFVNGLPQPLGRGNSIVLSNGTRFNAGRYTIEAQLVPVERFDPAPRQPAGNPVQAAQLQRYHDPYAVPMAGRNAEDALRDRSEFGPLWVQNSQDPLSYMDDAVDDGIGGSLDRMERGRDRPDLAEQALDPLEALSYGHENDGGRQAYPSQPTVQRAERQQDAAAFQDERTAHDPLRALDYGQPAPVAPNPAEYAPPQRPPQPGPPIAQPAAKIPAASVIPDDFLAQFGASRKARTEQPLSVGFQTRGAAQRAISQPLPQVPPAQPPGPATRIPEGFDPFSAKPAQKAAAVSPAASPSPQTGPVPIASPISTTGPIPSAGPPPAAGPQPVAAAPPPRAAPGPNELPPEPRTTLGNAAARPEKTVSPRAGGLSPALMADIVEFGGSKDGAPGQAVPRTDGTLDPLEALKARREQRKAAMLRKAQSGASSLPLPSMPHLPGAPPTTLPAVAPPAAPAASGDSQLSAGSRGAAADAALVTAFLEGMGFPDAAVAPSEYGRLMHDAGAMVRAMSAGLILLLSARKMVKSEFRMDVTQIQPEENNPFKFFRVAELALDELFLTRNGGFQAPAEAAKSAFEDLEQHTVLTMSAMQRAIKLIFERLSPDAMTGEADEQSGFRIRGLGARKGKLEAFAENHERMSRNIDSMARQVIGEAFAQVLEEHARKRAKEQWEKRT